MKNWIMSFLVAAFLLPAARADNDAAVVETRQAAAASDDRPRHELLYRVRHADSPDILAYLFGTVHVGTPDLYPLRGPVMQALQQSSRLVVEFDPRNQLAFEVALQRHGMVAENEDQLAHVPPEIAARLKQMLQRFDIPLGQVRQLRPWMLMNMLVALDLERHGYQREQGIEYFLLQTAEQQSKQIVELESADLQLALFNTLKPEEQLQYLRENLDELERGTALDKSRKLLKAWEQADIAAIDAFMRQALEDTIVSGRFLKQVLLDQRNKGMVKKIVELMREDGKSFVGVGLLHLLGEGSIPALLRERGYVVERVD